MTYEARRGQTADFELKGQRRLTLEEAIDHFGDPSDNIHPEEDSGQCIELVSDAGEPYRVQLGLPEPIIGAYGAFKQYNPPYTPHIFTSDRFILRSEDDPNNLLIDSPGLRILYMHGKWKDQAWVPSDEDLIQKGVTIPGLLSSFERVTREPIDVVWVCQFDDEQDTHPLETDTGHPYIYPISGYAQGVVKLERGQLTTSLNQAPNPSTRIEYKEWLAAFEA